MSKAKTTNSKGSDVKAEVAVALENAMQSSSFLNSLASVLVEIVAKKLEESMNFNNQLISDLRKDLEDRDKQIKELKRELNVKTDQLEMYTRRNSLRIFGIPESDRENTDDKVIKMVTEKLSIPLQLSDIDRSHRVGAKISGKNRPIIIKFVSYRKRREIFQVKKRLKSTGITVREDLTKARLDVLQAAIQRFGLASVWTEDGVIIVKRENTRFRLQSMNDLQNMQ